MANSQKAALIKLGTAFYERPSVVKVARELLGKIVVTEFEGRRTSGRIVEVEAYNGSWTGRVMRGQGGGRRGRK